MEIKINKEIRDFKENIYFGLSLRQFAFSISACFIAIILYFAFRSQFELEALSWICILGATPFAIFGFMSYNGMPAEKFLIAYVKSQLLTQKYLTFKSNNYYYELLKNIKRKETVKDESI